MSLPDLDEWWTAVRAPALADAVGWHQGLWTLPSRASTWHPARLNHAVRPAVTKKMACDTFLTAALYDDATTDRLIAAGPYQRATLADPAALTAVWADVDWHVDGAAHKNRVLADRDAADDALHLLRSFELEPTCVVATGGGYHLWWAYDRVVDGIDGSAHAWRIQQIVRHLCAGVGVDWTSDLTRLMRCPGSINHKGGYGPHGAPVAVVELSDGAWQPDALDAHLALLERRWNLKPVPTATAAAVLSADLRIPGDRERGARILDQLVDAGLADAKLELLWTGGWESARWMADQSPSGATLSIMGRVWRALAPNLDDPTEVQAASQAALDVGAAWRHRWADDAKMGRVDWWRRTLAAVTTAPERGARL